MKIDHNSIHLPELNLSFDSLKNHLKNIYKIDINMSNIDYAALEKTNVWDLYSEDIRTIEEEGSFEANHWVFSKVGNEYEAVYDGLYMHVFGSLEDLMARQKEIAFYEYDADKSEENGEETFVDSNGNEREYKEFAANGAEISYADERVIIDLGQMIDEKVYSAFFKYKGDKAELSKAIKSVGRLMKKEDEDEESIKNSNQYKKLLELLGIGEGKLDTASFKTPISRPGFNPNKSIISSPEMGG